MTVGVYLRMAAGTDDSIQHSFDRFRNKTQIDENILKM